MAATKFWMVWNENGAAPSVKHETKAAAVAEAERLARKCRGATFVVLEAVTQRVVDDMKREDLTEGPYLTFAVGSCTPGTKAPF